MPALSLTVHSAQVSTLNTGWVKDCRGGLLLPDAGHGRKRYRIRTPFTGVGAAGDGMQREVPSPDIGYTAPVGFGAHGLKSSGMATW